MFHEQHVRYTYDVNYECFSAGEREKLSINASNNTLNVTLPLEKIRTGKNFCHICLLLRTNRKLSFKDVRREKKSRSFKVPRRNNNLGIYETFSSREMKTHGEKL